MKSLLQNQLFAVPLTIIALLVCRSWRTRSLLLLWDVSALEETVQASPRLNPEMLCRRGGRHLDLLVDARLVYRDTRKREGKG
ncbi:hypothetical protein L6452_14224 [Arctium lappa]|uniref:Uncharacterized protein n=2 Tax=Arctium lappa TaxID=4217 RepID=A0ACB9CKF9_ARCLA|nr:hypothetical protein L6452_14223 [Arctium lappa]KAI3734747.1 hypothetical protein L6452_14224 [Arctium lappa]